MTLVVGLTEATGAAGIMTTVNRGVSHTEEGMRTREMGVIGMRGGGPCMARQTVEGTTWMHHGGLKGLTGVGLVCGTIGMAATGMLWRKGTTTRVNSFSPSMKKW
jgi:hypothetical protein